LFGDATTESRKGEPYGTISATQFSRDSAGHILTDGGNPIAGTF